MNRDDHIAELRALRAELVDDTERFNLIKQVEEAQITLEVDKRAGRETSPETIQTLLGNIDNGISNYQRNVGKKGRKPKTGNPNS